MRVKRSRWAAFVAKGVIRRSGIRHLGTFLLCRLMGDTPLLEDPVQVSAVEGLVEEVLEHHAAVQAVVLELVRHPGM